MKGNFGGHRLKNIIGHAPESLEIFLTYFPKNTLFRQLHENYKSFFVYNI
jgi:hypothetical protein